MIGHRILADSSIWLAYFLAVAGEVKEVIDSEVAILYTSVVTLHEVKRRLLNLGYTSPQVEKAIQFIKENSIIVPVDDKIALESVKHCIRHKLHTIDALIYETALENNCKLITADNDFKDLNDTLLLKY